MAQLISKQAASLFTRINGHLSIPLFRNAYALVSSSFLTAAIGMVYWIIAARLYPASIVGLNSALISAMMLIGGIAQLNLANVQIRFLPSSGQSSRRFAGVAYLLGPMVAAVIALIFLNGLDDWAFSLNFLATSSLLSILFILAAMAWSIFVLEDGVLTGLRRATWVPVENSFFGIIKIAFMLLFLFSIPELGIFASWFIGLLVIIIPTTYFIFHRLIPAHMRAHPGRAKLPAFSQLVQYAAGDNIAALAWLACTTLLPIMVAQIAGTTANAYYYLSWQIALLLYSINGSMGSSLVVEASSNQEDLPRLSSRVVSQLAMMVIPMSILTAAGAPLILQLFGKAYALEGSAVLRLMALSSIPHIIVVIFVSVSRVQRRISRTILVYGSLCVLVLGLSYLLIHRFGLLGVGYAWFGGQSLMAAAILLIWLREPAWRLSKQLLVRDRGFVSDEQRIATSNQRLGDQGLESANDPVYHPEQNEGSEHWG